MTKRDIIKKSWVKPSVSILSIKKDTFSGSVDAGEKGGSPKRPGPPADPTPR